MDAADGDVRWRYDADGAVKGGLALSDGRLFFGAYGGSVYALRQRDGGELWQASSGGGAFGIGGGNFYSTPAVAYGRVYIGSTNGRMYSFRRRLGQDRLEHDTGDYVYASPAVAQVPGAPALVYAGSYSGRFYAWDARTGDERWSRGGYGRISGGATVIGDIVYFADLGNKQTIGLGARTGGEVFEFERGSYNPVVSDGETIYLAGYHAMYALQPLTAEAQEGACARRRRRAWRAAPTTAGPAASAPARRIRGQPRAIRRSVRALRRAAPGAPPPGGPRPLLQAREGGARQARGAGPPLRTRRACRSATCRRGASAGPERPRRPGGP